jgi:hypothetical protein
MSELTLTCGHCGSPNPRALPYHMAKPDKCEVCQVPFRTWLDVQMMHASFELKQFRQSKLGSAVEAVANTAFGYLLALVCMRIIMWAYDFPMGTKETSIVVGWMTVVSVLRGYVIRRMWNSQFWKGFKRGHRRSTKRG